MKVKGPKNQAYFIEALYLVAGFSRERYMVLLGPRNTQIFSLNNAQILFWPPD